MTLQGLLLIAEITFSNQFFIKSHHGSSEPTLIPKLSLPPSLFFFLPLSPALFACTNASFFLYMPFRRRYGFPFVLLYVCENNTKKFTK